jgi:hypothetical protein
VALTPALPGTPIIVSLEQAVAHELAQPDGGYRFADLGALGELAGTFGAAVRTDAAHRSS